MNTKENFQKKLREYRGRLDVSAKDFAARIGEPYTKYVAYENKGVWPNAETLCKIATALYVSVDDLLDYEPNKIAYFKLQIAQAGYTVEEIEDCFFVEDKEKTFRTSYNKREFVAAMEGINDKVNESLKDIKAEVLRLQMYESFCNKYKGEDLTIVTPSDTI